MRRLPVTWSFVLLVCGLPVAVADEPAPKRTPKQALKAVQDRIRPWKCTGEPAGTPEERKRGVWTEKLNWGWKFKGDDAWLTVDFEQGKYFLNGELRYLPDKDRYQLLLQTLAKQNLTFEG